MIAPTKRHKYGVAPKEQRTNRDGILFDSKGEMERWEGLRLLERSGLISGLRRQVRYPLEVNEVKIGTYVADFVYMIGDYVRVVEDFKGCRTQEYRLKKRLMLALYGIKILETGSTPRRSRAQSAKGRRGRAGAR